MVVVGVLLKKASFAKRSSYPSTSSQLLLFLYVWQNRNFKVKELNLRRKERSFWYSCSSKMCQFYQDWLSTLTRRTGDLVFLFAFPVFFVIFIPQNTLITKMTNSPRVVEWVCLVMMLPTQVSQQTSGDSTCFLSDLKARWEPSCILTKPEICKHKQRTNFLSVSLLFSSKRCLPERRCFES